MSGDPAQAVRDLRTKISELEADRNKLRAALAEICCVEVWGYEPQDGGSIQNYLEKQGLLVEVPANEEVRREFDCETMLTLSWSKLALEHQKPGEGNEI